MDNAQDIIQTALDILASDNHSARVLVKYRNGNVISWYGRVTGIGALGDDATITLSDIWAGADGPAMPGHLLLNVEDILDISPA